MNPIAKDGPWNPKHHPFNANQFTLSNKNWAVRIQWHRDRNGTITEGPEPPDLKAERKRAEFRETVAMFQKYLKKHRPRAAREFAAWARENLR